MFKLINTFINQKNSWYILYICQSILNSEHESGVGYLLEIFPYENVRGRAIDPNVIMFLNPGPMAMYSYMVNTLQMWLRILIGNSTLASPGEPNVITCSTKVSLTLVIQVDPRQSEVFIKERARLQAHQSWRLHGGGKVEGSIFQSQGRRPFAKKYSGL